jgi:methylmalonyl-CoA mutase
MIMAENPIHSSLRESFPKPTKELWRQTASKEIEEKNPFDFLLWKGGDGINFFPYYDRQDSIQLKYLKRFHHTVGEDSFFGPNKWLNVPRLTVNDEIQTNTTTLEHLSNGADGVLFVLTSNPDLSKLLYQIEWPFCSLFFRTDDNNFFREKLPAFILQNNYDLPALTGSLFWETSPKKSDVNFYLTKTKNIKSLGIVLLSSPPAQQIASALTQAVNIIEELKNENDLAVILRAIAFSVPVDQNFFENIAKLKALRLLWYQVTQAYGLKDYKASDLHIHAQSEVWISKNFEPHGNMIKSTTAAMASVFGGCDSLTILEQDEQNKTMSRIARNVSSVIREESYLNKVVDPLGGAYAIDVMTEEIAMKGWSLFQSASKI